MRQEVGAQTRQLADEVQAFLDAGPPPVYVGFGSMPVAHPERMGALLRQAARTTGRRFIVCGGWSAVDAGAGRGDSLFVDDVPHALLFPRVAAVVHHGGSGTVATTARAGVPQVVFPSSSASGTSGTGGKRGDRRCDPNDRRRRADRAGGRGD